MISGLDSRGERFLNGLKQISRRLNRAQEQLTSGRRINRASDAPGEVTHLVARRGELAAVEQKRANLGLIKTEVDTAEQALNHANLAMDRVRTLAAQGASDVTSASSRRILAEEVEALLRQLVSTANSEAVGRFIFAGDGDQTRPYDLDLSLEDPVSDYQGSESTREALHPAGTRFRLAKTAREIFDNDDPAKNVFGAVNDLRLALQRDDVAAVRAAMGRLETAGQHLNLQLSSYGAIQNQVAEAVEFAHKQELYLKTQIAEIEDADMTAAVLEMNRGQIQQQAALGAEARRERRTLFDYLG